MYDVCVPTSCCTIGCNIEKYKAVVYREKEREGTGRISGLSADIDLSKRLHLDVCKTPIE